MEAVIDDPYILITDKKISRRHRHPAAAREACCKVSKNLLIIADDVDGEALATLAVNKLRGTINVVAVKAPGFGDRRKDNLGDLAALTGGTLISDELGRKLDSVELEDLGRARRVVVTKEETTIIEGQRRPEATSRAASRQIKAALETHDVRLGPREAAGAPRQARRQRRRHQGRRRHRGRAQGEEAPRRGRALSATRAAVEEGIVPGGGVAFINALPALDKVDARRRRAHRRRASCAARSRSRCAASPSTPARTARSSCRR